jgi:sortase B
MFRDLREYSAARNEYQSLREIALVPALPESMFGQEHEGGMEQEQGIDFDALLAINPHTVAWIALHGSDISYPVVQTLDNSQYLNRTFEGQSNRSGTIFLDHRDDSDFRSLARVYGHNMRDGSMFGTLSAWQGDMITVYTPDARHKFAVMEQGVFHESQLQGLASDFDGLMLITCVTNSRSSRYVVMAVSEEG